MNSEANQGWWFTTGLPSPGSEGCAREQPGRYEGLGIECQRGGRIPVRIPPKGVRNYLHTGVLSPFQLCDCPGGLEAALSREAALAPGSSQGPGEHSPKGLFLLTGALTASRPCGA